jgi:(1->4)-alpha-D-glucan 1-alpha-D-glucosylmutase
VSRERVATYRLQLRGNFGFDDAAAVTDYLRDLGVSDLYLSPILRSRAGSEHGYDVVDHGSLDEELGGREGFATLCGTWGPGIVVDIVPNHMAITDPANRWWWDVLKHGPASRFASYFDIDWDPPEQRLKRSILLPILGDHYGRVLEAGDFKLERYEGETAIRYYEHVVPLAPGTEPADLERTSSDPGAMHAVLEAQHYRLAFWKVAGKELNYRRFFAINDLAALKAESPEVFEETHELILELVASGAIDGLRIDHIDGLRVPATYLRLLQSRATSTPIWVEKILEGDETLPEAWPVAGTTGYDFLNRVGGIFVQADAEKPLTDIYAHFIGHEVAPEQAALDGKFTLMNTELAADVERLTDLFVSVCEDQPRYRDFTRPELRQALRETLASFDVYRTYVDPNEPEVSQEDVEVVTRAAADASWRREDLDPELFELLRDVLLLRVQGPPETELALRFQQVTCPVMAKGIEDTFFYTYNRFVALNEVGAAPGTFGVDVEAFHRANARAAERQPRALLATSTHDTKRSEDVRARLFLLSEISDAWSATVTRWARHNEPHRTPGLHDPNMEYLLYQTLVGAWPLSVDRARRYMAKAFKEAKTYSTWLAPSEEHDTALADFVGKVLDDRAFIADLEGFIAPLIGPGRVTSLAQTLLKLTSPGIPDLYQGSELWDSSLVDPDNRRAVDFQLRRQILDEIRAEGLDAAHARADEGGPKLFLIHRTLAVKKLFSSAFGPSGAYTPLEISGSRAEHAVAFMRGDSVITIVPRLVMSLEDRWEDTSVALPEGRWHNRLTGEDVTTPALADMLAAFPVALLTRTTP